MGDLDTERRRLVVEAVRSCDLTQTEGWASLSQLTEHANVESVETFEDEIRLETGVFVGALLWHVTLQFDNGNNPVATSESFPGRFEGRFLDGTPIIDRMSIDISSAFE